MDNYKKAYILLASEADKALKLLYTDNILEWGHIRRILEDAVMKSEALAAGDEEH